jgi:hypothetical protein
MLKQYGIVGTKGKTPWVQGNNVDFVFFSPNLKPLTHDGLKEVFPEPTAASQNSIRWVYTVPGVRSRETAAPIVVATMKKVLEQYPPNNTQVMRIAWQLNVATAVHFASCEDRRIVLALTTQNEITPKLAGNLGDLAVLRKHVHNYVFLKAGPDIPASLKEALDKAGPDGLVILERPEGRERGASPWQAMRVLAVSADLQSPASVLEFLDKNARPPGWDAKLSSNMR